MGWYRKATTPSKRTRARDIQSAQEQCGSGTFRQSGSAFPVFETGTCNTATVAKSRQVTVDQLNTSYRTGRKRGSPSMEEEEIRPTNAPKGDYGGEFTSTRTGVMIGTYGPKGPKFRSPIRSLYREPVFNGIRHTSRYDGPLIAHPLALATLPTHPLPSLVPAGTEAIKRCKPTNTVADVAVALGEIFREGLPKLTGVSSWKERTNLSRGAASEYLNSEFGWAPLVGEVQSLARAIAEYDTLVKQYERDAGPGRTVRRRYEFPVEDTTTSIVEQQYDGAYCPAQTSWVYDALLDTSLAKPFRVKTTRTYRRRWFSGAFTYALPPDWNTGGFAESVAKAQSILGLELTPEAVWNLTPWTWAIDWFSNAGDVVSNVSDWATDGLVLMYGYMMEHSFTSWTWSLDRETRFRTRSGNRVSAAPVTSYVEVKRRVRATPFGFGLDFSTFSPRQLAITAALGITRGSR